MTAPTYDRCVRCGHFAPAGRSTCTTCNPAGLPEPSRTQYHATVFLVVLMVLVAFAVVGIAMAGP